MKINIKNYISLLFLILATSIASAQVKFEAKVSKKKVGLNEPFVISFIINKDSIDFEPPDFKDFVLMRNWESVSEDSLKTINNEFKKTIYFRLVPKTAGKFLIEKARLIYNKNLYLSENLEIEVVKEDVYLPKEEETIESKFNKGVHLVGELSEAKISVKDSLIITYKLYISPEIGVSKWKLIDVPDFKFFKTQFIKKNNFEVYNGKFHGKSYRYVILQKIIVSPREKGKFNISALKLGIEAEIPMIGDDIRGNETLISKVTRTIKSNQLIINVN
ncbi:MAG: BatD family protein [Winogradskyella sp.]|uniref:BatD family protein n=1 Tax=Winogradskyella sp. TaxID=1883156 RepID=UPI00385BD8C0